VIKNFSEYLVEEEREVFFTFGRMNPPTIGHGKLIDSLVKKSKGADYKIYVSQSQDAKKNPLSYSDKIKHLRKMFPKQGRNIIVDKTARNAIDIATKLYDMGYKRITMVVGDDQVRTFDVLLNKYNGKKARHGFYNFESINIVSAGRRDPDAEGVEGMSATKMRQAATDNDYQTFAQGIPKSMSDKDTRKLFNDVRKGMGLKEERSFKRHIDLGKLDDTREAYVQGDLFELGDTVVVKESEEVGIVSVLGANYVIVECGDKKLRKWLDSVELVEKKAPQDPEIGKDVKGTQPKKYYAKDAEGDDMSAATKKKRAAHFKKGTKKDDDDSTAYKPAPGDKGAKTKPSKYTKAFKDMYDEAKQATSGGKVQKFVTGHKITYKGNKYDEIDMELVTLDNKTQQATFKILSPKKLFGNKLAIPFKSLRRGPFMATDTSKLNKENGAGDEGTNKLVKKYKKDTPMESVDEKFFGKTGAFGDKSMGTTLFPAFDQWMDKKVYNKKKYEKALRAFLDWRRKNPGKAKSGEGWDFLRQYGVERPRLIIKFMNDMVKQGKLPKHLAIEDVQEDAVQQARDAIKREKEQDKKKHDKLLDRARLARAKAKNRETK